MRLLFIKLKHIGDALLLTPTLTGVRRHLPDAEIHVVVRKGSEEILHGCNAIDHLWTTSAPEKNRRSFRDLRTDARLVRQLRKQRFDWSFELTDGDRGRWISLLAQPRQRATTSVGWPLQWIWQRHFTLKSSWDWMQAHRVEKDYRLVYEALGLPLNIPPLAFSPEHRQRVDLPDAGPLDDYVVIHPATRWERKKWPEDRWIALGHHLLTRTKKLVLTCGADPSEIASVNRIQAALGSACHSTQGGLSWSQMAGLMTHARLFVGVDTAAMHLAAACRTPTIALFGPSNDNLWAPWQTAHRIVSDPTFAYAPSHPEFFLHVEQRRMDQISESDVWTACDALMQGEDESTVSKMGISRR